MPERPALISVVIPTYERCASTRAMLDLLAVQTLDPADFEVVVIVDGSQDGTREMLEAYDAPYRLRWRWQPNAGLVATRNAGIALASGSIVVLIDDDMRPSADFVGAHLRAHRAGDRLCVLGPVPIEVPAGSGPLLRYIGQKFNEHLDRLGAQPALELGVRDFYGGNFSADRAFVVEAGGFDEGFEGYGYEDIDLWLRLHARGARAVLAPDAVAAQTYDKTFAQLADDKENEGRNAVVLATRHPGVASGLAFATDGRNPWWWRAARRVLLALTRAVPRTRAGVVALTQALERRDARRMHLYLRFVTEYFYWIGAGPALARARRGGHAFQGPRTAGPPRSVRPR